MVTAHFRHERILREHYSCIRETLPILLTYKELRHKYQLKITDRYDEDYAGQIYTLTLTDNRHKLFKQQKIELDLKNCLYTKNV